MSEDTDGASARAVCAFVALGEDTLYQVKVLLHSGTLVRVKGRERVTLCRDARLVRPSPLQGYCVKIVRQRTLRSSVPTGRRINVLRQDRSTTDAQIVRPYRSRDSASLQIVTCLDVLRRTLRSSVPTGVVIERPPVFTALYTSAGVEVCTA